ncbi:IS630-Spn1 transposase Orf2 [Streptococcus pneumoniae]|nr:IS630-Spn1 transposase Orf2 [Streptococcus pneumoniae]
MGKLELLCEEFGHKLLPLPPYSPEYNPIEKTWAHIKKNPKKVLPSCNTFYEALSVEKHAEDLLAVYGPDTPQEMWTYFFQEPLELLCEEFGHKLLPLPPYSPEYNPIEKTWAHIKKHLKKVLPSCNTFYEALLSCSCFN